MEAGYIVGYCLFLAIYLMVAVFMYSFNTYTKNRLFSKAKYSALIIVIFSLLILCFSGFGGFFIWDYTHDKAALGGQWHIMCCFILLAWSTAYLIGFILIVNINNKHKLDYNQIRITDWDQKIKQLKQQIGNFEPIKEKLIKRYKKYYQHMLAYYQVILNNIKDKNIPYASKVADIVTFNDGFSHKWSTKLNAYQLLLTYQYCQLFSKSGAQK